MTPILATLVCFALYLAGYHLYAKYLGRRIFQLDSQALTPAHEQQDGMDYIPTNKYILFGHHFASIAGLSPMLGPAIAVIWGWVPAMLWVVFGTLFIGAVHDFGALVVSIRARGMSIGKVAESIVSRRAKTLFHIIIFFLIALAMGVFVHVCATLLTTAYNPETVYPSTTLMVLALGGWLAGLQEEYFNLAGHGCCPDHYPAQCLARNSTPHPRSYPWNLEHSAAGLQFYGFRPSGLGLIAASRLPQFSTAVPGAGLHLHRLFRLATRVCSACAANLP